MEQSILGGEYILDLVISVSQIVIALVVGMIAWKAQKDSKRSSVASLFPVIQGKQKDVNENYLGALKIIESEGFQDNSREIRKFYIEMLEDTFKVKRALDIVEEKLLKEADSAWGLDKVFQKLNAGMNQNQDKEHDDFFKGLREKYL